MSNEHRSTPIPGNNQPKKGKNYMPLPVQNQQKSNNPHLPDNNKKLERNTPDEHRSTPLLGKTQQKF